MDARAVIFLLGAVVGSLGSKCPVGTVQGLNSQDCYYYEPTPTTWIKAEEACLSRGGHLTSVTSALSNSVLANAGRLSCTREFWIGGSYDTDVEFAWSWTDGRRFSFANWAKGEPTNWDGYCATIDVSVGTWHSRSCTRRNPFICKVSTVDASVPTTPRPIRCPTDWTYVPDAERKCLRLTSEEGRWKDAWAECKQLGGDLVSINSNATNFGVVAFALDAAGISSTGSAWFAIGLHRPDDDYSNPWTWTDGSKVTFTNWDPAQSNHDEGTVVYLGVFGQQSKNYRKFDGYWQGKTPGAAVYWKGICERQLET